MADDTDRYAEDTRAECATPSRSAEPMVSIPRRSLDAAIVLAADARLKTSRIPDIERKRDALLRQLCAVQAALDVIKKKETETRAAFDQLIAARDTAHG